ncbi:MAG: hypothetical protein R3Y54_13330 [Eubacteriales bacterium]
MNTAKWKSNIMTSVLIIVTSIIFFVCVSDTGYIMATDTPTYLDIVPKSAIRPIYPLFLAIHKMIFGEIQYLNVVVVSQAVLSVCCSTAFVCYLRTIFNLKPIETYVCYLLSLLVYTVDWPHVISSQYILTEGIAYPLFYLYMITLMQVVYKGGVKNIGANVLMTFMLSMIRTQLQLVWVISAIVIVYALFVKVVTKERSLYRQLGTIVIAIIVMGAIVLAGLKSNTYAMTMYTRVYYYFVQIELNNDKVVSQSKVDDIVYTDNQSSHALWLRLSYTIDESDINLFDTIYMKEIFEALYYKIDEAEQRYPYRPMNLWTWNHIANSTNRNSYITTEVINDYLENQNIDTQVKKNTQGIMDELSSVLLREHWADYIYWTLCLIPQGFVASIFVQIEEFYTLCYIITGILYTSALIMSSITIKNRLMNSKVGVYMIVVILAACAFIGITNLVFFALQRYVYYIFGVFYMAYYLLIREFWKYFQFRRFHKARS